MSLAMHNLLDIEKYFLLELTYCDNPEFTKTVISPEHPIPIRILLDSVPKCYCSSELAVRMKFGSVNQYMKDLHARLKSIYNESDNLKDVEIIGYINDNPGFLSNTKGRRKTGLVAFAFRDQQGNGMTIYRGCELNTFRGMALDWSGCIVAALGYVTRQHKKALAFFDQHMKDLPREWNILGHSKGGNLATYVFINRNLPNINCFTVNAQPYCWFAMTPAQKARLKTSSFEYIVHSKDPTRAASYVSYISRVIPLNRYIKKDLVTKHFLFSAGFDDYGNLEGGRILRRTTSRVLTRVFEDYHQESLKTKEELLTMFSDQMKKINNSSRYLSIGLDEIMLALNAEAATLWLKSVDTSTEKEFIYPYLIKGPVNDELYKLKLYEGEGLAADSAFHGKVHLLEDMRKETAFLSSVDTMTGYSSQSTVTVPLRNSEDRIIGTLQILNKKGEMGFLKNDLDMAVDMSGVLGRYIQDNVKDQTIRDFTLISLSDEKNIRFRLERNDFRELVFNNQLVKNEFYGKLNGIQLAADEVLQFNRDRFLAWQAEELRRLCALEISTIFGKYSVTERNSTVKKLILSKIHNAKEKELDKQSILSSPKLSNILSKKLIELSDEEYVDFELERAMLIRPMLIIVDIPDRAISQEIYLKMLNRIKELTEAKVTTAIILQVK